MEGLTPATAQAASSLDLCLSSDLYVASSFLSVRSQLEHCPSERTCLNSRLKSSACNPSVPF